MSDHYDLYLRQLQAEGILDSQGEFTVNRSARAEKLTSLVEQQPYIYLGRLLQAANVAQAHSIHYRLGAGKVRVEIFPQDLRPFAEFSQALQLGTPPKDKLQAYLELALLSAQATGPQKLSWSIVSDGSSSVIDVLTLDKGRAPVVSPESNQKTSKQPNPQPKVVLELQLAPTAGLWQKIRQFFWDQRLNRATHFIHHHCCFGAIATFLNGARLNFYDCYSTGLTFAGPYFSRYHLAVSTTLENKVSSPERYFGGPSPGDSTALAVQVPQSDLVVCSRSIGAAVMLKQHLQSYLSYRRVQINAPAKFELRNLSGTTYTLADSHSYLGFEADITAGDESPQVLLKKGLHFRAPDACLLESRNWGESRFACSKHLVITSQVTVLGPSPIRSGLVPIRDGLALERIQPSHWEEGWLAFLAVPDFRVDVDQWRIVQDDLWNQRLKEWTSEFSELALLERQCREDFQPFGPRGAHSPAETKGT